MKSVAQTIIEADRFYTIAAKTGSVIQAVESVKDGGNIRLGKYERKPEQEWAFVREGDGVYRIRNRASGKLIDLMMTGTANGTWLHLWEDVGGTSQMWKMEPTPAGTVRLRSMWAAGKCIDTVGMGTADGAVLQIWQETAGEDQQWSVPVQHRLALRRIEVVQIGRIIGHAATVRSPRISGQAHPTPSVAPAEAGAHVSIRPPQFHEEKDMGPSLRWGDGWG